MPPAKKTKGRGRFWLIGAGLCAAAFLAWRFYFNAPPAMPDMMGGVPPVRVAEAIVQNVPHYLNGLGTVVPSGDVLVQSRVGGQLLRLNFKEGQRVKAGDLLAEIDPRPFQAELEKARGALAKDRAQLENARRDLARYVKLAKNDFIAEQQYENQRSLVRQWEGAVESGQAAVDSAALQLEYSRITAPISGRLGLRAVDEGNQITANAPEGIVRITETSPCDVLFTLPESQVGIVAKALRLREADPAIPPLQVQAWDREDRRLLATGELVSLDNQIDHATGTVKLKARFANEHDELYPNQFVNARLLAQTIPDAVTVPAAAVQLGSKGSYCYLIDTEEKDGKKQEIARYREVTPGIIDSGVEIIEKGVKAGDIVVVDGIDRLRDGIPVRIAAAVKTANLGDGPDLAPDETAPPAPEKPE